MAEMSMMTNNAKRPNDSVGASHVPGHSISTLTATPEMQGSPATPRGCCCAST